MMERWKSQLPKRQRSRSVLKGKGVGSDAQRALETLQTDTHSKNILITDDEDVLRELISNELKAKGYRCVSLASKKDAYAWCLQHHPDLVITDIRSPDMDGFQLLRLLKSNAGTKTVPIVFLTGYADEKNASLAKELGAAEFLPKPCKLSEFQSVVERLIGKGEV